MANSTVLRATMAASRGSFESGKTAQISWRLEQLKNLLRMMDENESLLCEALYKDLRKPKQESITFEINYIRNDVRGCINNIHSWVADRYVEKNIVTLLDDTLIHYDPLGVVLIMGAWNYPLMLSLGPLGGAIAAGNCVIIKPSEIASATSNIIATLLPRYLDKDCFHVVEGGVDTTVDLLREKFDYIFFTGSGPIGQKIREAANKFLTPVTLELGGKCPVFVDRTADLDTAARRLVWAKCINLGQTCIAPDFVVCDGQVAAQLADRMKRILQEWYGNNPQDSPDLCRIINERNWERLNNMLDATRGKIVIGGERDLEDLYIAPTVVTDVTAEDSLMTEEIFGPILPILTVKNVKEALQLVNSRDKPLSLYVFSTDKTVAELFKAQTSSGSMVINDAVVHLSVETLPFGGVGASGMGSYHGRYTFLTFSHEKSVLVRDFSRFGEYLGETRYPPYAEWKINRLDFLVKNRKIPSFLSLLPYFATFALGVGSVYIYNLFMSNIL